MAKSAKAKKSNATAAPARKGGKKAAAKGGKAKNNKAKQEAGGIKGRLSRAQSSKSGKAAAKGGKGGKTAAKPRGGNRAMQFLREVRVELSKVTWPTRDELVQSTIAVMVAVLITGVFIFLLDVGFSRLIGLIS